MGISEILPFISFGSTIVTIVVFMQQASDENKNAITQNIEKTQFEMKSDMRALLRARSLHE